MLKKYKGQAGSRKCGTCDKSRLQEVLNRIAARQSQCYVSTQLGIVRSTLQNRLKQKHMQKLGRPTDLSEKEELAIAERILATAEWGFPFDSMDIMMLVKNHLDKLGENVERFKSNVPGPDWLESYLKHHSDIIHMRLCQSIKKKRAAVSKTVIINYFNNLQETLEEFPPQNIINYDETNLSDDPGRKKVAIKRGAKYSMLKES